MTKAAPAKSDKTSAADFVPERLELPILADASCGCEGCELYKDATQTVFGEGAGDATCVFIGEQPGDTEDIAGRPFVGPAGQLLDSLLEEAGVRRERCYVTNAVKHFRFEQRGNRRIHAKPLARHINACRPWLEAELQIIRPPMIVALGATAAQSIMGRDFRVTKSRGEVMTCPFAGWFLATIHPSAILRIPTDADRERAKGEFIDDMRKVARQMKVEEKKRFG